MIRAALYAPEEYHKLTPEQKADICGGCGPGHGLGGFLIPDKLWGLNVTEPCNIHDYMYHVGETIEDKKEADRVLLNNMLRLIDSQGSCWLVRRLRTSRAMKYYNAVRDFGGPAFWSGKNPIVNLG